MKIQKLTAVTAALAASLLTTNAPRVLAQDASPAPSASAAPTGNQNQGGRGGQGGYQNFRQQMMDRLKTALKATDQEWAIIQPLLEKVQTLQRSAMGGRGPGGFGGRRGGGPGGQGGQGAQTQGGPGAPAGSADEQALRTALDTDSTTPQDIKAKLEAVRAARAKAKGELEQAREDLKKVLSLRQEATLVMMGMLE